MFYGILSIMVALIIILLWVHFKHKKRKNMD